MAVNGVGRQANQLDAALGELGLKLGESAQLCGTDRLATVNIFIFICLSLKNSYRWCRRG
jgi:hypothetical protein